MSKPIHFTCIFFFGNIFQCRNPLLLQPLLLNSHLHSHLVNGPTPDFPAKTFSQVVAASFPRGVTASNSLLHTTLFFIIYPSPSLLLRRLFPAIKAPLHGYCTPCRPPPNPTITIISSSFIFPASNSSTRCDRNGADDVFPYFEFVLDIFSSGKSSLCLAASIIRILAWCGIKKSTSSFVNPAFSKHKWKTRPFV